jgi:hypothetical protein
VGGELDLMVLIGGTEERAAIQWEKSMWKMFEGHVVRKRGDKRSLSDDVYRKGLSAVM